jgi:SAM-dependent methyltransferase
MTLSPSHAGDLVGLTRVYLRLLALVVVSTLFVPVVTAFCSRLNNPAPWTALSAAAYPALAIAVALVGVFVVRALRRRETTLDDLFAAQTRYLDELPIGHVDLAIFGAAAVSLFLELAVIRWQGTVFEFFAFYKNFTLLSCFAGLGIGYSLAAKDRTPLPVVVPLLAWQFVFLIAFRSGMPEWSLASVRNLPFQEQLNMGVNVLTTFAEGVATYVFLSVAFVLTALAFVPIGQVCGRLMKRRPNLRAYGLNLLGSLCGVALTFLVSYLWTPPIVWYGLAFAVLLLLHVRQTIPLAVCGCVAIASLIVLAWPVGPLWLKVYSPYQMLELGHTPQGYMEIRAAGHYYQRVFNLARSEALDSDMLRIRNYYDLPYRVYGSPADVAVVGAGSGNDVAAAVRSGARYIDAIEIDPAILAAGKANHPEHPYDQPQVRPIVNDARTFLRTRDWHYDMVVYGLLDSHTLLSHASSVRLDSFVYTVEGFRDARSRLKDGGVLVLSFALITNDMGRKIHRMLEAAFDGQQPKCVEGRYDHSVTFFQSRRGDVQLPPDVLQQLGFRECTARFADPSIHADLSTDDWPFFYMPRRTYPVSYLAMIAIVLALSLYLIASFSERPTVGNLPFFFLGAGFMLVETKGITEMGLAFGNTWQVIGIVIAGILTMAFLANWVVQSLKIERPLVPYLLLLASLLVGVVVARSGGFSATAGGQLATTIVLTSPLFFSGIVFSSLIARDKTGSGITGAMAANLFGAMCGGLLEYNAMYFGFQFLYWLAAGLYAAAFVSSVVRRSPAL